MKAPLLVATMLAALALAGCVQNSPGQVNAASATAGLPFPAESAFLVNGDDGKPLAWSVVVEKGSFAVQAPKLIKVPSFDGTKLSIGVFLPDVPAGTKVPVLMDVGPYFGELDDDVGVPAHVRLGKFLIENFVPHGYAVVQANVRGTGQSEGCGDYFGEKEQKDLDALVTFLGKAEWSDGNVGIIGKSYDGTTAWLAAATGNPFLKTIVPIEGIDSMKDLHFHNGSAEVRAPILGALYSTYEFTPGGGPGEPTTGTPNDGCATTPLHAPMGAYGYATGGGTVAPGPGSDYWAQREFRDRVLKNYHGSVFVVHGFQDWNVKPNQGTDLYNALQGNKKLLIGEWAHDHADRASEHPDVRMDWAEMLLRWFDHELKHASTDTGPSVILEDTHGYWRAEPANAFPPLDATWTTLHPNDAGKLVESGAKGSATLAGSAAMSALAKSPAGAPSPVGTTLLTWTSEPFAQMTRISGQPTFHVTVTPRAPGGLLWAELHELTAEGKDVWIGRAQMNLDYAAGGATFAPVTPGAPIVAKMQFYPMDARILAGSKLKLVLTQEGGGSSDVLPRPEDVAPIDVSFGDKATTLSLPIIQRPDAPTRWDMPDLDISKKTGGGAASLSGDM